jgi:CheY-like chemotaxis protein
MIVRVSAPRPKVLVVDDDAMIGRAMARTLASVAYVTVEQAPQGALSRIAAGERFDVVLCDVMMPVMTGPDLFEQVRACAPEAAGVFVFITGGMTEEVGRRLRSTGRPWVEKPVTPERLRRLVTSGWVG